MLKNSTASQLSIVLFVFLSSWSYIFGQQGISGTIIDGDFNEPLPFANIIVKETDKGVVSDFDGNFSLELEPGTYSVVASFVGYQPKEITNVEVDANNFSIIDIVLSSAASGLEEVVISVEASTNSEASVLAIQKRSASLMDGLSAQSFKKVGASTIASAIKRVPGVSVQGGKYVYVRGLGDRYSKSILNGVDIPGLDPDKNTVQMDLFPTNMLSNIQITKSARADLPADFTGGVVDIITKDIPTRKEISVSASIEYNPSMHFNNEYLTYSGSTTDWLGFDDGTRDNPLANQIAQESNPILGNEYIPLANSGPGTLDRIASLSKRFDPQLGPSQDNSGLDYGFGIGFANRYSVGQSDELGLIISTAYKKTQSYYEDASDNIFNKDPDKNVIELSKNRSQIGTIGENNVIISGLLGVSFKTGLSKFKFNAFHIQNGESTAGEFRQETRFSDFIDFNKYTLEYFERSISNGQLSATHSFSSGKFKLEWMLSGTLAKIHDKDIRNTSFQDEEGSLSIPRNTEPKRFWRYLDEVNYVSKIDLTKRYSLFYGDALVKFGVYVAQKERDFSIDEYSISTNFTSSKDWARYGGDPNKILDPQNILSIGNPKGTFLNSNTTIRQDVNTFNARQENYAFYASNEFNISQKLKSIVGLRMENYSIYYTGENVQRGLLYDNQQLINDFTLFPSANLIYSLTENTNLRLAYAKTTARPSFKEASIAAIFDPISNLTFIGNINITPSYIDNFDLRFESYGDDAQLFSLSAFYKSLQDPIEIGFVRVATTNYTPRNLENAKVYGLELELRKKLSKWIRGLRHLNLNFNGSYIISNLPYSVDERDLRTLGLRNGETLEDGRELQGQSPFLINAGLSYDNIDKGLQAGIYYNVQGKTLEVVGDGFYPDVFTMPFHDLTLNIIKKLKNNAAITIKVQNILGETRESIYHSFRISNRHFRFRDPGRSISIGYQISL